MSTRGTLGYIDNWFIDYHRYHEALDQTIRIDLKILGITILSHFKISQVDW